MSRLSLHALDNWMNAVVSPESTIRQAIGIINSASIKFAIVCTEGFKLVGTVSDGDIRRGLLRGVDLNDLVSSIMNNKPLIATEGMSPDLVYELMVVNQVCEIPEVSFQNRVIGLKLLRAPGLSICQNIMVIMAGGRGSRLLHHTEECPKPMLKIGGRPMLEHIIAKAKGEGFRKVVLAVNYLSHVIENYFGNGEDFGIEISYIRESSPLGTAGALSLIEETVAIPFVVTNGDVLTDISYRDILDFHALNQSSATMAVRPYEWQNPFGVVEVNDFEIISFEEKPVTRSHINAGIYVLNPSALNCLIKNKYCDMPTLFQRLKSGDKKITAYPVHENWQDIGSPSDLYAANEKFLN